MDQGSPFSGKKGKGKSPRIRCPKNPKIASAHAITKNPTRTQNTSQPRRSSTLLRHPEGRGVQQKQQIDKEILRGRDSQRTAKSERGQGESSSGGQKEKLISLEKQVTELVNDYNLLSNLSLHLLEELSLNQTPTQIIQQLPSLPGGVNPPPVPKTSPPTIKQVKKRAYSGQLMKLELMLELKKRILNKQEYIEEINAEKMRKEDIEQIKIEVKELTDKISELLKLREQMNQIKEN